MDGWIVVVVDDGMGWDDDDNDDDDDDDDGAGAGAGAGGGGSGGGGDGDGGKGGEWHSSALHTWILSEPQPVPAHFVFELSMYFFGGSAHPCASHSAFASSNVASKGLMVVFGLTAELQIDLHWPMSGCVSLAIQHRTAPRFDEGMYVRSAMPPKAPWPSVLTHMSSYKGTVRSIHTLPGRPAASIVVVPSSAKPSASTSGAADAARAASIAVVFGCTGAQRSCLKWIGGDAQLASHEVHTANRPRRNSRSAARR